jgi:hypothetical protein
VQDRFRTDTTYLTIAFVVAGSEDDSKLWEAVLAINKMAEPHEYRAEIRTSDLPDWKKENIWKLLNID